MIYVFDTDEQKKNKREPIGKTFDTYCNGLKTAFKRALILKKPTLLG
ncbi:hypothetical protein [Candidatus Sodalis sp. SoCistrobi]|nr:hypothetical protein [Candidatus Sodalis sp. SoCistrobi]